MTAPFLSDVAANGTRERNYTGELRGIFGQLARVGAGGCGLEHHLSAMRAAVTNSTNVGFLRPTANLAVVLLADEDDCSASNSALFGPDSAALGRLQSLRCFAHGVEAAAASGPPRAQGHPRQRRDHLRGRRSRRLHASR